MLLEFIDARVILITSPVLLKPSSNKQVFPFPHRQYRSANPLLENSIEKGMYESMLVSTCLGCCLSDITNIGDPYQSKIKS